MNRSQVASRKPQHTVHTHRHQQACCFSRRVVQTQRNASIFKHTNALKRRNAQAQCASAKHVVQQVALLKHDLPTKISALRTHDTNFPRTLSFSLTLEKGHNIHPNAKVNKNEVESGQQKKETENINTGEGEEDPQEFQEAHRPEERQHPDREQDIVPSWERQAPAWKGHFPPNTIQDKTLSPPRDMLSLTFRTLRTERSWLARKGRWRTGWKSIEAAQNQTAIQQSGSRGAVGASQSMRRK